MLKIMGPREFFENWENLGKNGNFGIALEDELNTVELGFSLHRVDRQKLI